MILCTYCGGSFAGALQLASHLDNSRACALAEYRGELDSLPPLSSDELRRLNERYFSADRNNRRFATDPIQRNRAGNRRTEDKGR